jgi:predicted DNA-binding protein (MmcQ/YjbR family)
MNVETLRQLCLSVPGAEESLPFGQETLVYKVMGKMFALIPLDTDTCSVSVKCDPEKAIDLRERYEAVTGARHFNKTYWNTLYAGMDMDDSEMERWIKHSVEEVISKFPQSQQTKYRNLNR